MHSLGHCEVKNAAMLTASKQLLMLETEKNEQVLVQLAHWIGVLGSKETTQNQFGSLSRCCKNTKRNKINGDCVYMIKLKSETRWSNSG